MERWYRALLPVARRWKWLEEEPEGLVSGFLAEKADKLWPPGSSAPSYEPRQIHQAFRNHLIGRLRHLQAQRRLGLRLLKSPRPGTVPTPGPESAPGEVAHAEGLRLMRGLAREAGQVLDLGAVLLLAERVHCARAAWPLARGQEIAQSPSEAAEAVYPWSADDESRRVRSTGRPLVEMWKDLAPLLDRKESAPSIAQVAARIGTSAAVWYQWVHRARESLAARFPDHWRAAFPHWRIEGPTGTP